MHQDWNEEAAHLESIVRFIALSLKKKLGEKDHLIREQAEINRSMWEDSGANQDLESISDFMQHIGMLKQNMAGPSKRPKILSGWISSCLLPILAGSISQKRARMLKPSISGSTP
jgi:hypothetical protein